MFEQLIVIKYFDCKVGLLTKRFLIKSQPRSVLLRLLVLLVCDSLAIVFGIVFLPHLVDSQLLLLVTVLASELEWVRLFAS